MPQTMQSSTKKQKTAKPANYNGETLWSKYRKLLKIIKDTQGIVDAVVKCTADTVAQIAIIAPSANVNTVEGDREKIKKETK